MSRESLKFLIYNIGIVAFQIAIFSRFRIFGISPDLLLVYLIMTSLNKPRHFSAVIGFTGGLIQDMMTGGTLGIFAFSKSLVCYVSCLFPASKHESSRPLLVLIFFLMAILDNMISTAFLIGESAAGYSQFLLRYGLPSAAITAISGIGIVVFLAWIKTLRIRS